MAYPPFAHMVMSLLCLGARSNENGGHYSDQSTGHEQWNMETNALVKDGALVHDRKWSPPAGKDTVSRTQVQQIESEMVDWCVV